MKPCRIVHEVDGIDVHQCVVHEVRFVDDDPRVRLCPVARAAHAVAMRVLAKTEGLADPTLRGFAMDVHAEICRELGL